jgi:glycogen operon protein
MSARRDRLASHPAADGLGLGAQVLDDGVLFSVFSAHAEAMQLCLFDADGRREIARLDLPDNSGGVWSGFLPGAQPGLLYGYRAHGPYAPESGHRFNPHKLLLDPYARQLAGELQWHDALYGFSLQSANADLSFDRQDSAPYLPKGVVAADDFDWGDDAPPRVPWHDTVIYELHVRGFTKLRADLPAPLRGTFAALGHASTIAYLRDLGITAVELLPVHAFVRDRRLFDSGLTNYWGYNTLAFFAPEAAYCAGGAPADMKAAIRRLHAAGIEVILDVVYNHTGEGNELGPTLSLRGLDNASYYRLLDSDPRCYVNDTGCGNTLDFTHPRVIQLALDSLRHWVRDYHVDGFRFDLSTTLGREAHGFDPGAGFFDALLQDPVLAGVKLIAEPWDLGPGGFQLGNHPPRFAEWNANFRDSVRRYWRGSEHQRGALAAGLQGSAHLFDRAHRKPWASINFVTAHDGFTLQDLVSYNHKHNDANGEDNRDGSDHNDSGNWGEEGASDDTSILALRARVRRSLLATLLCAHGTPMLLAGDEFGHTQLGNNNAYCQDNPLSWLDWQLRDSAEGAALHAFVRELLALRRRWPLLQGRYFQHARVDVLQFAEAPPLRDVFWFDERGVELGEHDWRNPTARLLGLRRAARREDGGVDILLLLCNADAGAHGFRLPALPCRVTYRRLLDTAAVDAPVGDTVAVAAHALVLLGATLAVDDKAGESAA